MENSSIKWEAVLPVAEKLGVGVWARIKWRQRGAIPPRWHLPLLEASNGTLTARDILPAPESKLPACWSSQGAD